MTASSVTRAASRAPLQTAILAALALSAFGPAHAAGPQTRFLSGTLSVPVESYADEEDGAARVGGGGAVGVISPLQNSHLASTVVEGYVLYNRLNPAYFEEQLPDAGIELGGWTHFGLLAGLRFSEQVPGAPQAGLYAEAQGGLNIVKVGDIKIWNENVTVRQTTEAAFSPAFAVGGGLREGRYGFSARYLNLGEPKLRSTIRNQNTGETQKSSGRQEFTMFTISASYYF